jgi:hypothetical protein
MGLQSDRFVLIIKFCTVEEILTGQTISIYLVTECYIAMQTFFFYFLVKFRFYHLIMYSGVLRLYVISTD